MIARGNESETPASVSVACACALCGTSNEILVGVQVAADLVMLCTRCRATMWAAVARVVHNPQLRIALVELDQ